MIDNDGRHVVRFSIEIVCALGHVHRIPAVMAAVDGWRLDDYVESVLAVAPSATAVIFG